MLSPNKVCCSVDLMVALQSPSSYPLFCHTFEYQGKCAVACTMSLYNTHTITRLTNREVWCAKWLACYVDGWSIGPGISTLAHLDSTVPIGTCANFKYYVTFHSFSQDCFGLQKICSCLALIMVTRACMRTTLPCRILMQSTGAFR